MSKFTAFSLRNFPLHLDQMESLGVTTSEIDQYARAMAETLAMMHWISEIDGNDIEFVLAPPSENGFKIKSTILGEHSIWVLDFDLCRRMTMDLAEWYKLLQHFGAKIPTIPGQKRTLHSGVFSENATSRLVKLAGASHKQRKDGVPCQGTSLTW